ncbi:MAG: holo-ACP synthase [Bacteroidales bacterium]
MTIGIGTDLFDVSRMKTKIERQPDLVEAIFNRTEIDYCEQFKNKVERYAGRYAAKEALMKALGTGWRDGITFKDVTISNDKLGKPDIQLTGKARELAEKMGVTEILVSISHTSELANAIVILNNNNL